MKSGDRWGSLFATYDTGSKMSKEWYFLIDKIVVLEIIGGVRDDSIGMVDLSI